MARRLAVVLLIPLLVTGSAWAAGSLERKRQIDAKIGELRDRVADAGRKQDILTDEISAITSRIRTLEGEVASASSRLGTLEGELAVSRNRLAALTQIFELQTERLELLTRQHAVAEQRLNERLVAIYQSSDPTPVEVVLSATSFADLLDQLDYVRTLGEQDRRIAREVGTARREIAAARRTTQETRAEVVETTKVIEARHAEQLAVRDRLRASQRELSDVRSVKQQSLETVQVTKEEYLYEIEGLEKQSAAIAARIRAAQRATRSSGPAYVATSGPSAAGMVWPVSGRVTSGFGWRWGRMHEGIDIAAPTGTPIVSAAAGRVIYAGWMGGYGQLVIVDHGGGIATAYAHMSTMGAGVGQSVSQGQVIGYVGCTGHCYGSHLHFEVRVNGAAVDPLRYL
jgi:murein DD-endopeptidase MepM/ murein hydrolase activator NlpD